CSREGNLHTASRPAPVQHAEHEHAVTDVEERLDLVANLLSPCVRDVAVPPSRAVVAVIDRTADRCKRRMELDLGIATRDKRLDVAGVERSREDLGDLDVLVRHRLGKCSGATTAEPAFSPRAYSPCGASRPVEPRPLAPPDASARRAS